MIRFSWIPRTGKLDIRSRWHNARDWNVHRRAHDMTSGTALFSFDDDEVDDDQFVQYRIDGGSWIDAGIVGVDGARFVIGAI